MHANACCLHSQPPLPIPCCFFCVNGFLFTHLLKPKLRHPPSVFVTLTPPIQAGDFAFCLGNAKIASDTPPVTFLVQGIQLCCGVWLPLSLVCYDDCTFSIRQLFWSFVPICLSFKTFCGVGIQCSWVSHCLKCFHPTSKFRGSSPSSSFQSPASWWSMKFLNSCYSHVGSRLNIWLLILAWAFWVYG